MKVKELKYNGFKRQAIEFDSLSDFYDYITNTQINEAFRNEGLSSKTGSEYFTKTKNYEEAVELFKKGWSNMATKLTQKLKVIENKTQPMMKPRKTLSMCGYQAIVPLYLNGAPNNMVNKKMQPVKQKVIDLNKSIDYSVGTSSDTIIEESIKALQIVKKLEAQGYRCNLNIVLGAKAGNKQFFIKLRIKSANEKLNVSKVAFPLVHPSMLRRLFFRFIEVYPEVTKDFVYGYGKPAISSELREVFEKEYLLPNFIKKDIDNIRNVNDLENI